MGQSLQKFNFLPEFLKQASESRMVRQNQNVDTIDQGKVNKQRRLLFQCTNRLMKDRRLKQTKTNLEETEEAANSYIFPKREFI